MASNEERRFTAVSGQVVWQRPSLLADQTDRLHDHGLEC
jgi:hypothetical protein